MPNRDQASLTLLPSIALAEEQHAGKTLRGEEAIAAGTLVAVAIVHHANQYLITDGYTTRPGITSVVGSREEGQGLACILELHREYRIPANIHVSGTLLETLAWWHPQVLHQLRSMYEEGLVEIVGSAYAQNIMRFFNHRYNVQQLNEELDLYQAHLGIDPGKIKSFWPPERVWDTNLMAAVLRDPSLRNDGYDFVFLDDRVLLSGQGQNSPRKFYDHGQQWTPQLFHPYRILRGQGLVALPISTNLRQCIPPREADQQRSVEAQLQWLSSLEPAAYGGDFLAVYGDDMEKPAGVGWDSRGPSQFEDVLRWLSKTEWAVPVKVCEWAASARIAGTRSVEGGTYVELANHFNAGEMYEKWYYDPKWTPYQNHFAWSESRVQHLAALGADSALIELAEKHMLISSWETAWHTPAEGAHGKQDSDGAPSGSMCAVASHSRHAAVIAEAAFWQRHKDDESHTYLFDIDHDGEEELILKNDKLFAVVSPRRGGRLVALFAVDGAGGAMVIGNPSDDWDLKEELNDYMDVPPNHPGALAEVGFEHDSYRVQILVSHGPAVHVRLQNDRLGSSAFGLTKDFSLSSYEDTVLRVSYDLPAALPGLNVEFGLSPDYLKLLRCGSSILSPHEHGAARGCRTENTAVWVRPEHGVNFRWTKPYQEKFGHGQALRLSVAEQQFGISIGVERF